MKWIRKRVLDGEIMSGTWVCLGCESVAEIAGSAGFDWLLIDMEHGVGDAHTLIHLLQAAGCTAAAPIVRLAANDPAMFKRALDLGASGIMVPQINSADEARLAAAAIRYPPQGIRGLATITRASRFGYDFDAYLEQANDQLLTVIQIETADAVDDVYNIAGVEGVDVLFVGPADLTLNLGIYGQIDHPKFIAAVERVIDACRKNGKQAGILLKGPEQIASAIDIGFTFIAIGTDIGLVSRGMKALADAFAQYKQNP